MRPVHHAGGMQGGLLIRFIRRNNQPAVFPVVEIPGAVAAHAPMPDSVLSVGLFLVFAIPVIYSVHGQNAAAVGLNGLAAGIQPFPAGIKCMLHEKALLF